MAMPRYVRKIRTGAMLIACAATCLAGISAQVPAPDSPEIEARVNAALAQLTLEEKIDLLGGVDSFNLRAEPKIGVPLIKMSDGPMGARSMGGTTAYPAGIGLAATWNPILAEAMGVGLGRDSRARGIHILLAPGVNIYRAPVGGRNFEYMGEDPFLAGKLASAYIRGLQSQGVVATVKHFAANNEEYDRHGVDSVVDERTLRELYLPAFEMAVKEGHVGAIMNSYNLVNGEHSTQNAHLNCDIAKGDWKFDGIIMSDWVASYDGVAQAKGCLDVEMPSAKFMNRKSLMPAIHDGTLSMDVIDDKVRRILRMDMRFHFLEREQTDVSIPLNDAFGKSVALQGALEAPVLLKNAGDLLPLASSTIKSIALIGPNAYPAVVGGGGSSGALPFEPVSLLEGMVERGGKTIPVLYDRGLPDIGTVFKNTVLLWKGKPGVESKAFSGDDWSGTVLQETVIDRLDARGIKQNIPANAKSIRYTATFIPATSGCHVFLSSAIGQDHYTLYIDGSKAVDLNGHETQFPNAKYVELTAGKPVDIRLDYVPTGRHTLDNSAAAGLSSTASLGIQSCASLVSDRAKKIAALADVVVLSVGFDSASEREGMDRTFELPYGQEELIKTIATINPHIVAVLNAGGAVDTRSWLDKTPALLHAWYPGQEGGRALAALLFGDANPSGKLPMSFDRSWEEDPVHDAYYADSRKRVVYSEGLFNGYRYYTSKGKAPLFPFGYGLSYTKFAFSDLKLSSTQINEGDAVAVSFRVANTGTHAGDEVAQLYLGDPSAKVQRPNRELKGFQRVSLKPGESCVISMTLDARAMSYYDVKSKAWTIDPGKFVVMVGDSSENTPLSTSFTVKH